MVMVPPSDRGLASQVFDAKTGYWPVAPPLQLFGSMRESPMVVVLAVALTGCFETTFADGEIACGEAGCPPGMSCGDDGFCYRNPDVPDPGSASAELALAIGHDDGVRLYAMCGGELRSVWTTTAGPEARQVAWGDIDGDGVPELAAANMRGAAVIYGRRRDGFAERVRVGDLSHSRAVALFDVDGDGDDDLAVGHDGGPVRLYRASSGAMQSVWASPTSLAHWEFAAGDYDGDGDDDLAVAIKGAGDQVYRTDGGALSLAWTDAVVAETEAVAWGDIDGDGRAELATAGTDSVARVRRFDGSSFAEVWASPMDRDDAEALDFADYDRDGRVDLAVGNWDDPDRVFRNVDGNLTAVWSADAKSDGGGQGGGPTDGTESLTWLDYDGDGDDDLYVGRFGATDLLLRNDGGTFVEAWSSPERDPTRSARWMRWQRPADYPSLCDTL
jgi:hypothetical protein